MATIETVHYLDDLAKAAGREVKATRRGVEIMLDGKTYELDLGEDNYQQLTGALAPYVAAGRRQQRGGTRGAIPRRRPSTDREQIKAIRAWARRRGFPVSDRGRIPDDVVAAFHGNGQPPGDRHAKPEPDEREQPTEPEPGEVPDPEAEPSTNDREPPRFATKAQLNQAVREWATRRGATIAPRGKVPSDVMDQYVREHGEPLLGASHG